MKVVELLESRRENWKQLESLCLEMEKRRRRRLGGAGVARFTSLYRAACADLALADAYQLPPETVAFLHQLVARAHNQLYRSRRFNVRAWGEELFGKVPRRLYHDNALRLAFVIFWGIFIAAMILARESDEFARNLIGADMMSSLQEMYATPLDERPPDEAIQMVAFYIQHNTSIGLECFAYGLLGAGIGGLGVTIFNSAFLGAVFGFMSRTPQRDNFFMFVTAHGPFELTAIVLCAAAGMRLGFSLIDTRGRSRLESLVATGRETMPTIGAAIVLFALAAFVEGVISPSGLPYAFKALVAVASAAALMFYFVVLGQPREAARAI
jgi:uncharacterized membrane protein SpoIIM required for sporulation